jgi:DNA modification methylase
MPAMTTTILVGDVRERLRQLADNSIHCIVTSPPYWGLRDYGVDGQIGLESSPAEFIATMVEVFEELRRVLRPDGTCWVNMGDSYAAGGQGAGAGPCKQDTNKGTLRLDRPRRAPGGLKPKDLCMMPHRLAIALQDAGWWVRQDIVWHKPNPMPESVRDRCTKAHEYIFLLTKSEKYYFDQDAIAEPVSPNTHARLSQDVQSQIGSARANGGTETSRPMKAGGRKLYPGTGVGFGRGYDKVAKPRVKNNASFDDAMAIMPERRNKRSVWTITTQPFSEAHFATFPPELPETCIKSGCPPGGTVLDPFFGAGTTGLVADRLQRNCIGIEINPAYAEIARRRIQAESTLFAEIEVTA